MYIKTNKKWQNVLDYSMIVLGTLIMGFAFSVFLEPNNISVGGFSALAMVISTLFENVGIVGIPTSAIYLVLNIGLYVFALKTLGRKFAIKSLVGIVSFSLGMQIFDLINFNITYELFVSAIFGGAIMGVGVGLVVRFGGSTGGSDMIASIIKSKKPNASLGSFIIVVDMIIIGLTLFVFANGFELLPYTITALLFCMYITDFVNDGYKQVRAYNIVTTKPEEMSAAIMAQLARGCSCTSAKGMHSNSDKTIVICLVSKYQAGQLKSIIKDVDPAAFVYATKVGEVIGEWNKVSKDAVKEK
jgi:uncharacterized membrane-anchored protein YitT (DUF2179 family)